jgi:hypothetical protein
MHRRAVSNIESLVEQIADQWRAVERKKRFRSDAVSRRPLTRRCCSKWRKNVQTRLSPYIDVLVP